MALVTGPRIGWQPARRRDWTVPKPTPYATFAMGRSDEILTVTDIAGWPASSGIGALKGALEHNGLMNRAQVAGRNWPVGCVSLEITQRCNLDCTLCYLSDLSEAVHDLPLAEVLRRIEMLRDLYGTGTNIQVSGGDPTLRRHDELVAIIEAIAKAGMHPALLTNGIKADRHLLAELAAVGLKDVAFHVDLTQERKGYGSERDLNAVRADYLARARGLGLRIMFNTTLFAGNISEVENLCRFFLTNASEIHLASFQLQADTGRGVLRGRAAEVSQDGVMQAIRRATGCALDFDMPLIGHPECNRYTAVWVAGRRCHPLFDDHAVFARLFAAGAKMRGAWRQRHHGRAALASLARSPALLPGLLIYVCRKLWQMRRDLLRCHGRVHKLSFLIHNFMDSDSLKRGRCESCVFMAAGRDGPVSMCVYNARRDREITQPLKIGDSNWDPVTGLRPCKPAPQPPEPSTLPFKRLKGRYRAHRGFVHEQTRRRAADR